MNAHNTASRTLVLRIFEDDNAHDLQQFDSVFHIRDIPSLVVFGPNSAAVTHSWVGALPSPDAFAAHFPLHPPPIPSSRLRTKISLQMSGGTLVHEFSDNATLAELKKWIASELGTGASLIVAYRRAPFPDDNSLTVAQADLVTSAVPTIHRHRHLHLQFLRLLRVRRFPFKFIPSSHPSTHPINCF
jgi:hypothetical protein